MIHVDSTCAPISFNGEASISRGSHKGFSLVGVFDGHGGKRCSRYAATHMPENFHVSLNEIGNGKPYSFSDFSAAFRIAYRMTHEDFARMARGADAERPKTRQRLQEAMAKTRAWAGDSGEISDKLHSTFPQDEASLSALRTKMLQQRMAMGPRVWDDGSTALCCLVRGAHVVVANAGDSRAVACVGGRAVALSVDHKPNLPAERARIHLAGGTVTSLMGCHRVMGMLAMSRALGDVMIEQYLSQEPDLTEQELGPRDFVVMASDGLWDVMTNHEAAAAPAALPAPLAPAPPLPLCIRISRFSASSSLVSLHPRLSSLSWRVTWRGPYRLCSWCAARWAGWAGGLRGGSPSLSAPWPTGYAPRRCGGAPWIT